VTPPPSPFSSSAEQQQQKPAAANTIATMAPLARKILNAKTVIKLGHIGAANVMPNGDRVLEISRLQLIDEV
jgi:hypothetical protein